MSKKAEQARFRTIAVLTAFQEQGAMLSWDLSRALNVDNPEVIYKGRKVRHIIGDLTYEGWLERTGSSRREGTQKLALFELTSDGADHLAYLQISPDGFEEPELGEDNDPEEVLHPVKPEPQAPPSSKMPLLSYSEIFKEVQEVASEIEREIVQAPEPLVPSPASHVIPKVATQLLPGVALGLGKVITLQAHREQTAESRIIPKPPETATRPDNWPVVGRLGDDRNLSESDHLAIALASANKQGNATLAHVIQAVISVRERQQKIGELLSGFISGIAGILELPKAS